MERILRKKAVEAGTSGFTLIELLVVISIIAVLMSVMVPALQKARESAKTVVCQANEKQQGLAIQLYAQDNSNTMMPMQTGGTTDGTAMLWMYYIAPYINSEKGAKTQKDGGYWLETDVESTLTLFKCPAQTDKFYYNWYVKYGVNPIHATNFATNPARKIKITQINKLDQRLIVADSMDKDPKYITLDRTTATLRAKETKYNPLYGQLGLQVFAYEHLEPVALVADRHNRGSNALFLDGRVQWLKYEDLMFKKEDDDAQRSRKISMWDYRELKAYYNYER